MYRRYKPKRKSSSLALPVTAIGLTAAALLLWGIFSKGEDFINFFKGKTIVEHDSSEANERLDRLMADLSGDKPKLLELAADTKTRLGWITNENTSRQFRYFLLSRLVDKGLWDEAVVLLPEVESKAPIEGLDRLAEAALAHSDFALQLRLDRQLQELAIGMPAQTLLLLRSIRRTAETCMRMNRKDDAIHAISRLDMPDVLARLKDPALAAEAAALQLIRADASEAKDPVLQMVRNILEKAGWPLCPATSRLMLEEVSTTLRDNPNMAAPSLKEVETKLLRCRDSMLEYPDREHRLPQCYTMLGELRYRLGDYNGCAQALTLAGAFAEGYGEMTPELQLKLCRVRARANEARGAVADAMDDYRFLLERETDPVEVFRCLTYMATHSEGSEKIALLTRCWDMIKKDASLAKAAGGDRARIAKEVADYYVAGKDYANAIRWVAESARITEETYPDLTDGKALRARVNLALVERKTGRNDASAVRRLRDVVRAIEGMDEETRAKLDAADSSLYRTAVREFARTYLVMGDKSLARDVIKKIREGLPDRTR